MASVHLTKQPDVQELYKDHDEVEQAKAIVAKASVGLVAYPLTFSKTLFQLGYEPYPLSRGKTLVFWGQEIYYLPNVFKYIGYVYKKYGFLELYRGAEAGLACALVGGFGAYYLEKFMDNNYPEIGGNPGNYEKNDDDLTDYESFLVHLRHAIRRSVSSTIGVAFAYPFTVLMVREIAQHVGGETKYPNVVLGILRVGDEEGLPGLFSGLIPSLLGNFIHIWGISVASYSVNRLLLKAERNTTSKDIKESIHSARAWTPYLIPFAVNGLSYPFQVCSTVFSVVGSHLIISMLPYTPPFGHWHHTYYYLEKTNGLKRGGQLFMRAHKGPMDKMSDTMIASTVTVSN